MYYTDPNFPDCSDIILESYSVHFITALNIWNAITDNEREYLHILARNIPRTPKEFSNDDKTRMDELKKAINVDRQLQPNENLEIMINTGRTNHDLIKFISRVREKESALAKDNEVSCYKREGYINLLVTVLAQINWSAQPFKATDDELADFEGSVQGFVERYNQRKSELVDYNKHDKDKQIKINEVDTIRNLRRFGISDLSIVNKMELFNSEHRNKLNDLSAYSELKELYPCLRKGFSFEIARKNAVVALNSQGKMNKKIAQLIGLSTGTVSWILKEIRKS